MIDHFPFYAVTIAWRYCDNDEPLIYQWPSFHFAPIMQSTLIYPDFLRNGDDGFINGIVRSWEREGGGGESYFRAMRDNHSRRRDWQSVDGINPLLVEWKGGLAARIQLAT